MRSMRTTCIAILVMVSLQVTAIAQSTTGYSIVDNNQDNTQRPQQLYSINVVNGTTNYMGDLVIDRNGDGVIDPIAQPNERIIREYEGLASIDGVLYGIAEFAGLDLVGVDCNSGVDPISGLSSDLRTFRSGPIQTPPSAATPFPAPIPLVAGNANGISSVVGPQIGQTCINSSDGGTEAALGYNQIDGFLYSISSEDTRTPAGQLPPFPVRSNLYRISPTTGLATFIAAVENANLTANDPAGHPQFGDPRPYIDGLTILPNGTAFGTEMRFDNRVPQDPDPNADDNGGLYQINLSTGVATFCRFLVPTDLNVDTGLAHRLTQLFLLNERGVIYSSNTVCAGGTAFTVGTPMSGPAAGTADSILGCRGGDPALGEFLTTPANQACRDFEGFDIPQPGLR